MAELDRPSNQQLVETYDSISSGANKAFNSGLIIGNPILNGLVEDRRWSLCAQGYIDKSPANNFLKGVIDQLESTDPSIEFVPRDFLHLTLGEVVYNPEGRPSGLDAQKVVQYYQALRDNLPQLGSPIKMIV